jgi:hypothetical protein
MRKLLQRHLPKATVVKNGGYYLLSGLPNLSSKALSILLQMPMQRHYKLKVQGW